MTTECSDGMDQAWCNALVRGVPNNRSRGMEVSKTRRLRAWEEIMVERLFPNLIPKALLKLVDSCCFQVIAVEPVAACLLKPIESY